LGTLFASAFAGLATLERNAMDIDPPLEEPLQLQTLPRYEGDERRRPRSEWLGIERRLIDPPTEQDHPEEFGPN
jgi:hypothetical protein